MYSHLRSNLILLVTTVLLCCVVYPAMLYVVGQSLFPGTAEGSLVYNQEGQAIGSRLIAQPFTSDEYFHPRPSAVGYNAAASGASNWGASNPKLRQRVVATLGPILKYRDGRPVGPDIVTWVQESLTRDRTLLRKWVELDPLLAEHWGAANVEMLTDWEKANTNVVSEWQRTHPDQELTSTDRAKLYFEAFAQGNISTWPVTDGGDLQVAFFEVWWATHPDADVLPVPADMVMASSSGLDPHITLKSARYQLDRVALKVSQLRHHDLAQTKTEIESLLKSKSHAPLNGLAGVDLVNVLEVNLAIKEIINQGK